MYSLSSQYSTLHILNLNTFFKIYFYLYVFVWNVYYMCVAAHGDQKKALDHLELELQMALSHLMWVLGTQFLSFGGVGSTLNCGAISPTLNILNLIILFQLQRGTTHSNNPNFPEVSKAMHTYTRQISVEVVK